VIDHDRKFYMVTALTSDEDFFDTGTPWLTIVLTLLPFIACAVWLIMAYYGLEYAHPPWNTRSVPPPLIR